MKVQNSRFISRVLSNDMTPLQYYIYLRNQLFMYWVLESVSDRHFLFEELFGLQRSSMISLDIKELENDYGFEVPSYLKSTLKYVDHIRSISDDEEKLLAHIYVRHMGDLVFGKTMKQHVYGKCYFYDFNEKEEFFMNRLHSAATNKLATEVNTCYDLIYEFLEELEDSFGISV